MNKQVYKIQGQYKIIVYINTTRETLENDTKYYHLHKYKNEILWNTSNERPWQWTQQNIAKNGLNKT